MAYRGKTGTFSPPLARGRIRVVLFHSSLLDLLSLHKKSHYRKYATRTPLHNEGRPNHFSSFSSLSSSSSSSSASPPLPLSPASSGIRFLFSASSISSLLAWLIELARCSRRVMEPGAGISKWRGCDGDPGDCDCGRGWDADELLLLLVAVGRMSEGSNWVERREGFLVTEFSRRRDRICSSFDAGGPGEDG